MATAILLSVVKPDLNDHNNEVRWRNCTAKFEELASKNKDVQLLGENVVQLTLNHTLDMLLLALNDVGILGYKYLVLNEDTKWIEVPSKA